MKFKKVLAGVLAAALVVSLAMVWPGNDAKKISEAADKNRTRSITTADLKDCYLYNKKGKEVKFSKFEGKPTIINFWATWCGPCTGELPHFQKYYKKYRKKINFVMVNIEESSCMDDVKKFVKKKKYTFPLYFDFDYSLQSMIEFDAIPCTVAINKKGEVVETRIGSMTKRELKKLINKIK